MKAEWTNSDSLTTSQTTKAILVIDVPMLDDGRRLCNECPIWNKERLFCEYDINMETKGCQLKPMPDDYPPYEKTRKQDFYTEEEFDAYEKGWNDCIDEITGETE